MELRPQGFGLGDRSHRLPRHRGGDHRADSVVVVCRHRLAERGAVGGLAAAAPGREPDRAYHDPFQVHHLGMVEDGELRRQPSSGGERLEVRERGIVEPVPWYREGTELEHPQADAVAAVVAFQPADLAQLFHQTVQGRLRQPGALVQVGEAQHLLTAVERLHDRRAPAQDGVLRGPPVAAVAAVAASGTRGIAVARGPAPSMIEVTDTAYAPLDLNQINQYSIDNDRLGPGCQVRAADCREADSAGRDRRWTGSRRTLLFRDLRSWRCGWRGTSGSRRRRPRRSTRRGRRAGPWGG